MSYYDNNLENLEEVERSTRCLHLSNGVLNLVHRCVKDQASLYVEAQLDKDSDVNRAYNYSYFYERTALGQIVARQIVADQSSRTNRRMDKSLQDKSLQDKTSRTKCRGHNVADKSLRTSRCMDKSLHGQIVAIYLFIKNEVLLNMSCGTRVLHEHLNQIYHRISEGRISKVLKASSACGQIRPAFSNKGPRKIIQAKQVFERFQVDLVDLSRRPVTHDGFEFRYALVVLDIFSRYLFLRALKKKSSVIVYIMIFNRHAVFRTFINQE
ncbi:unnamed protein product [Rotaria socialis]|uniref:Integrase catalytic domain-containing protein n=1 Tax=Rotaria socialis TaxID=392032 RepID=A0A818EVY4_9BILA|nr:unnamed protein product [Rotaria socialis]